ncbi:hypothetical protein M0R45_006634 [Rubus argutus]|uniref:Uncharacterized protein n=1 Tax=Rubus argutus TaxID=59490 RepID=A0AAW1YRQ9_RUBAR
METGTPPRGWFDAIDGVDMAGFLRGRRLGIEHGLEADGKRDTELGLDLILGSTAAAWTRSMEAEQRRRARRGQSSSPAGNDGGGDVVSNGSMPWGGEETSVWSGSSWRRRRGLMVLTAAEVWVGFPSFLLLPCRFSFCLYGSDMADWTRLVEEGRLIYGWV